VQAASTTLGGNQYRVINSGNVTVFLGYGVASSDASNNAVVVTSSQASFPLLAGTDEILTFVPGAYFTGITSSGTATIYITPGDGA
jgi:Na+/phosphate symporter